MSLLVTFAGNIVTFAGVKRARIAQIPLKSVKKVVPRVVPDLTNNSDLGKTGPGQVLDAGGREAGKSGPESHQLYPLFSVIPSLFVTFWTGSSTHAAGSPEYPHLQS